MTSMCEVSIRKLSRFFCEVIKIELQSFKIFGLNFLSIHT